MILKKELMQNDKRKGKNNSLSVIKEWFFIIIILTMLSKCGYDFYKGTMMRRELSSRTTMKKITTATVVNDEYNWGYHSSKHTHMYMFVVNNKQYKGICSDESYHPGDTIRIMYVVSNPNYNVSVGDSTLNY